MLALRDMEAGELGDLVHNFKMGSILYKLIGKFPFIDIESEIFPITTNVMRVHVDLQPDFVWDDKYHGSAQFLVNGRRIRSFRNFALKIHFTQETIT